MFGGVWRVLLEEDDDDDDHDDDDDDDDDAQSPLRARGRWGEFCWFESFRGSCILFRWVSHHDLRQPACRDSKKVSSIKSDLHQNVLISQ